MGTGAVMIFRVDALPTGSTPQSVWNELTRECATFLDSRDDFFIGGPIAGIDLEELEECYLSEFTPLYDTYVSSGLWLDLNLYKDYFGVGYERGDMPLFVKIAEWLEARLTNCDVFYGHDCTSVVRPFTRELRSKLLAHYQKTFGLSYGSDDPVVKTKLQKAREEFEPGYKF